MHFHASWRAFPRILVCVSPQGLLETFPLGALSRADMQGTLSGNPRCHPDAWKCMLSLHSVSILSAGFLLLWSLLFCGLFCSVVSSNGSLCSVVPCHRSLQGIPGWAPGMVVAGACAAVVCLFCCYVIPLAQGEGQCTPCTVH